MQKHHTRNHIARNKKGFSLIELLIVIAIILIIAAIAIPNLMRARRAANEASAVASIRTILNCQLLYLSTHGKFTSLSGLAEDGCLDELKVAINSLQVLEKSNLNNLQQLLFQLQIPVVLLQVIVLFLLMKIRLFDLLLAQQLHPVVHHLANSFKRASSRV